MSSPVPGPHARPFRSVRMETDAQGDCVVVKRFHHANPLRAALDGRRARRELAALQAFSRAGLPVPRALGLQRSRAGWELRLEPVPGARRLDSLLTDPTQDWATLAQRLGRLLAALQASGWEHGDLHPGNVLVDERGQPWLVDLQRAARRAPSRARGRLALVRAEAMGREFLPTRTRLRFFTAWRRALPEALRSAHGTALGVDRRQLLAELERRGRDERRRMVLAGLGRWQRESSRVQAVQRDGRRAWLRRGLAADWPAGAPAIPGVCLRTGSRRALERLWLAAARLEEHRLPVARPALLVLPSGPWRADGRAYFEVPAGGAASVEELRALLLERGLAPAGLAPVHGLAGLYLAPAPSALTE